MKPMHGAQRPDVKPWSTDRSPLVARWSSVGKGSLRCKPGDSERLAVTDACSAYTSRTFVVLLRRSAIIDLRSGFDSDQSLRFHVFEDEPALVLDGSASVHSVGLWGRVYTAVQPRGRGPECWRLLSLLRWHYGYDGRRA